MDYQALYRRYRPQRFGEVVGQDHVTATLLREVVEGKVAHAYLFAGPRGTGKTTTARLLAKSLNCTNRGADGEPCTECPSCVGIAEGTSLDVIELDAASHNKVEDIREIRVNVSTVAAAGGARRVYILDEAHMLSRAAGNALLKTLEEPPEHVVFVLATTEPYKLLDTIRSRSQRFDFHPMPFEVLVDHLDDVSAREGFNVDAEAMTLVANHAAGSMRDALSLLEQVAALGEGKVAAAMVSRALGLADKDAFSTLASAIRDQDAPAALGLVAKLASQGADLRRFVSESVGFFRGVFLAQYSPNLEEIADESPDTLALWRAFATELQVSDVLRAVDQLSEALLHVRQGREERLVIELAMLRLTRPETAVDVESLQTRLGRLEARVRELAGQVVSGPNVAPRGHEQAVEPESVAADAPFETPEPVVVAGHDGDDGPPGAASGDADTLVDLDLGTLGASWPAIVARVREVAGPSRHAWLKEAVPAGVEAGTVTFHVPTHLPFHLEQLREDRGLHEVVSSVAIDVLGGAITLEFVPAPHDDRKLMPVAEPERAPDRDDLLEEGKGDDPTELLADLLGGEIVSE
ncbi:MAG TPA: DNA polymerase III subunit gamma/tau [Acidimicrobiia bacterium]|jgi:DNA polymerase-3 subunit gamma/tau